MKVTTILNSTLAILSITYILSGCVSNSQASREYKPDVRIANQSPSAVATNLDLDKSIRSVDFRNFSYSWHKDIVDTNEQQRVFTLQNGVLSATYDNRGFIQEMGAQLVGIIYGDTTHDGAEEAIVILSFVTGGSAMSNCIYIYTLRNNQPLLLWSFLTGDRADGGLRDILIEKEAIIIELYSPIDKKGDCCPSYFKRMQLSWQRNQFTQAEEEELRPNISGHGSPILSTLHSAN